MQMYIYAFKLLRCFSSVKRYKIVPKKTILTSIVSAHWMTNVLLINRVYGCVC